MPQYPSVQRLKEAVERLRASRAKPVLADYLIGTRALHIAAKPGAYLNPGPEGPAVAESTEVPLAQSDPRLQKAMDDVIGLHSSTSDGWEGPPFLFVFDEKKPYRQEKHRSNGTADTIANWSRDEQPPLKVTGSDPRKLIANPVATAEHIAQFFFKRQTKLPRPKAIDLAIWWFRYTDVENEFGGMPTDTQLVDRCRDELGVTHEVWDALFDPQSAIGPVVWSPTPANPKDFAPEPPDAAFVEAAPLVNFAADVERLVQGAAERGFTFEPWQIAAYITAVRTKPLVILAGISGTGKTKLPRVVAEQTSSEFELFPVRPDWTDSTDLLGYRQIDGTFVTGRLLEIAKEAQAAPHKQYFVMLDEMNIARVEYYLAEVLSHIEERFRHEGGMIASNPLAPTADVEHKTVCLPSNLCVVGSVNMDETTHGFSRKVLDRSFVLEFSEIALDEIAEVAKDQPHKLDWTAAQWCQQYLSLAEYPDRGHSELKRTIGALTAINACLKPVQLQVGYRVRDEIALFCVNAQDCIDSFIDGNGTAIDPLDLAVAMKILPRIQGGSAGILRALTGLLDWASGDTKASNQEPSGDEPLESAQTAPAPEPQSGGAADTVHNRYPVCAARIRLMLDRYHEAGFTSFWL